MQNQFLKSILEIYIKLILESIFEVNIGIQFQICFQSRIL